MKGGHRKGFCSRREKEGMDRRVLGAALLMLVACGSLAAGAQVHLADAAPSLKPCEFDWDCTLGTCDKVQKVCIGLPTTAIPDLHIPTLAISVSPRPRLNGTATAAPGLQEGPRQPFSWPKLPGIDFRLRAPALDSRESFALVILLVAAGWLAYDRYFAPKKTKAVEGKAAAKPGKGVSPEAAERLRKLRKRMEG